MDSGNKYPAVYSLTVLKCPISPVIFISLFTFFLLPGCTDRDLTHDTSSDSQANPVFHWFLYEGNDPVYDDIQLQDDEYLNPVISGFYPDPSIIRVDDDYYMVHSSFSYFPGIPIFHSKDLVNWEQVGHVLDRPTQLDIEDLGISRGVFAPTINYHDGVYYVLSTLVDAGGNFLVTSENPAGPWSELVWLPDVQGIDPSIFFDDDGRIYILNNGPAPGEPHYYFLGLSLDDAGETNVRIEKRSGDTSEIIASAPLDGLGNPSAIYLKIEAKGPEYAFWYATVENDWKLLKDNADGKILSTQVAGGFVGSFFGMYAFTNQE